LEWSEFKFRQLSFNSTGSVLHLKETVCVSVNSVYLCVFQMQKLSYAQIAQKSKETSADIVNSADRCVSQYDDVLTTVRDNTQSLTSAGVEPAQPRPQRGSTVTGAANMDSRPPSYTHSHGRQRAGAGGGHVSSADEIRHRDYNGVSSSARPLP